MHEWVDLGFKYKCYYVIWWKAVLQRNCPHGEKLFSGRVDLVKGPSAN